MEICQEFFAKSYPMSTISNFKFSTYAPVSYTHLTLPTIYSV